jgi:hypothetical protein
MVVASVLARKEVSTPTILVSIVIPIAIPAVEALSTIVFHVPQTFLFSNLDVA